jgi:thymidylate synthase
MIYFPEDTIQKSHVYQEFIDSVKYDELKRSKEYLEVLLLERFILLY